jgi:hypothetical protein
MGSSVFRAGPCRPMTITAFSAATAAFLIFLCGPAWSADRGAVTRELTTMSAEGFLGTPAGFANAEKAYKRAKALAPQDGRVEYAWSLVLKKHFKAADAAEHLELAASAEELCLAARGAIVRQQLRLKTGDELFDSIVTLAELTGDSDNAASSAERKQASNLIGRMVEYLQAASGDGDAAQQMRHRETAVRGYLSKFESDYSAGRATASAEIREMQNQIESAIADAAGKKIDKLRDADQRLRTEEDKYKTEAEKATQSRDVSSERLADVEAQLTSLDKQFRTLVASESKLNSAIIDLTVEQQKLANDLNRISTSARANEYPAAKRIYLQQIDGMQIEIELLRTDLGSVMFEKDRVLKQAQTAMQAWSLVTAQQNAADQANAKQSAQFQRWQRNIKEQSRKTAAVPAEKTARVDGLRRKLQSWSTYDKVTPQAEFESLLSLE